MEEVSIVRFTKSSLESHDKVPLKPQSAGKWKAKEAVDYRLNLNGGERFAQRD
jgi:hypothetical protein